LRERVREVKVKERKKIGGDGRQVSEGEMDMGKEKGFLDFHQNLSDFSERK
jgi:hypothetical protein